LASKLPFLEEEGPISRIFVLYYISVPFRVIFIAHIQVYSSLVDVPHLPG